MFRVIYMSIRYWGVLGCCLTVRHIRSHRGLPACLTVRHRYSFRMDQIEIVEFPEADAAPMPEPAAAKVDGRSKSSATNGAKGGCPIGSEHSNRSTYLAPEIIDAAVECVLSGKGFFPANVGPVTERDRKAIQRFLKMPAEEFQSEVGALLKEAAILTGNEVIKRVKAGEGKLNDLTFLLSVAIDKQATLSGRGQINNANVGTQINIITNESGRAEILEAIKRERQAIPVESK